MKKEIASEKPIEFNHLLKQNVAIGSMPTVDMIILDISGA